MVMICNLSVGAFHEKLGTGVPVHSYSCHSLCCLPVGKCPNPLAARYYFYYITNWFGFPPDKSSLKRASLSFLIVNPRNTFTGM